MLKSLISFLLLICQFLQSFFMPGNVPSQKEDINFDSIKTAVITGEYALGDEDPVITIELKNTVASDNIKADMFELTELFSTLEITDVAQNGANITLFTDGVIPYEIPLTGGVDISAKATEAETELRAECELLMRNAYIEQDSFVLSDGTLAFDMVCLNGTFTFAVGDVIESNGLAFTVKNVSDDGADVTLAIPTSASDLDSAIAQVDGKEILIPADKLSSGIAQTVLIYANEADFGATVNRFAKTETQNVYNVTAVLYAKNGVFADDLTIDDVALDGEFASATITALTKTQNTYTLEFTLEKSGINLNKVSLQGSVTVAEGKIRNLWNTVLPECTTSLDYIKSGLSLDGYKKITALIPAETGVFDRISEIGSYIGTAAGIVNGVRTVLELVGVLESTDAKIEDTRRLVKEVQVAIEALDKKLDNMGSAITAGTVETMSAVQYNTYITASGNWDHFLGSYVTPLQSELTEFRMAYNEYMLNYIMNAHSLLHTITVWKDEDGNVTLPHPANGTNSTWYSVDGKVLASIDAYKLVAELKGVQAKVMQNGGRLYDGYWEDIVAEINDKQFESMFVDITKEEYLEAVQMNATLHALETAGATDILNAFTNLCNAIAGEGTAGGLKPLDNYLTMLSMYYNFYIESAKDIQTTLTWLYSVMSEGAFVATMAYNFTPSAEKDIVNKSFDKAAYQVTKASVEKDPYYSYVANKTLTVSQVTQYEYNSTKGLQLSHETELYLGNSRDGNLIHPDTFKTGTFMDELQMNLMYKRYEYLCKSGVCNDPSFRHYIVSTGLVHNNLLFDPYGVTPTEALIITSPISLDEIPLDNSVEMTITRVWESSWYKVGDVITIGEQGKVSEDHYISHFRRCADTIDFDGNITENNVILAQAEYYENHWYWGAGNSENWACIVAYPDTMLVFMLG